MIKECGSKAADSEKTLVWFSIAPHFGVYSAECMFCSHLQNLAFERPKARQSVAATMLQPTVQIIDQVLSRSYSAINSS